MSNIAYVAGESSSGKDPGLQNQLRGFESLLSCHKVYSVPLAEQADAAASKAAAFGHAGSTPAGHTRFARLAELADATDLKSVG